MFYAGTVGAVLGGVWFGLGIHVLFFCLEAAGVFLILVKMGYRRVFGGEEG